MKRYIIPHHIHIASHLAYFFSVFNGYSYVGEIEYLDEAA